MPPKAIFKGQVFCLSGKLSQSRKDYEELIKKHGGEIANSVTGNVTFLISNEDDVKAATVKVATAQGRGLPIVQEGFIGACVSAKKLLEVDFFMVKGAKKRKAAKAKAKAAERKAGKPAKKPKGAPVVTCDKTEVIAKSGLADKAAVVKEEITKGFVKGVLVWDVELVLHDVAKGTDKYYNMQVLASNSKAEHWTVQHWGRTGMPGTVKTDGPFETVWDAKKIFKRRYRQKTGLQFGQLGGSFEDDIPGKYKLLAKDAARKDDRPGTWQYYLHNKVDGKKIGWYDYEGKANVDMEKYFVTHENNVGRGLEVRFVRSDYFRYEINFAEMTQTNTTSGTRRVIRRVAAGERGSADPPAHIPEPAKPKKPAEDSEEEEEDEDEDEEDEDDEDEGEGDCEGEGEAADEDAAEPEEEEAPAGRAPPPAAAAPAGRAPPPAAAEPAGRAPPPEPEAEDEAEDEAPAGRAPPPAAEEEPKEAAPAPAGGRLPMELADTVPPAEPDDDAMDTLVFGPPDLPVRK